MTRTIQYLIHEADAGKRIGEFLQEKQYSRSIIIELKKTEQGIRKNGQHATVKDILACNDQLEINLIEEVKENIVPKTNKNGIELEVLYEDEDILVLNKPSDTPIHPSINNYDNTLANAVAAHYQMQGKKYTFRCINRLDRDTTGTTIIAKNMLSASILGCKMKAYHLKRTYIALVEGITEEKGIIDLPIGREEGSIIKRRVDQENGKHAITHFKRLNVIEVDKKLVSLVALTLETGRTHQIRVHMSAIGHSLLGDFLYNAENHMLSRQALHAAKIIFEHPITGEELEIIAPLPEDMKQLIHDDTFIKLL